MKVDVAVLYLCAADVGGGTVHGCLATAHLLFALGEAAAQQPREGLVHLNQIQTPNEIAADCVIVHGLQD